MTASLAVVLPVCVRASNLAVVPG